MKRFRIYDLNIEVPLNLLSPSIEKGLEKGWYERDEVEIIRSRLGRGDRVVELGAGIGVTALVAGRLIGPENVLAFEANPALIGVERANAELNALPVRFHNRVLLPESRIPSGGTVSFHVDNQFWASSVSATTNGINVPAASLENEILQFGANTLVMDIEGLEVEIIEQADLTRINKFIFEIHYDKSGMVRTNAAVDKLLQRGCDIDYSICSRGVLYLERRIAGVNRPEAGL